MRQTLFMTIIGMMILGLSSTPIQANFVQCPGGNCNATHGTTNNTDIINGTPGADNVDGLFGNDIVFGGEGDDSLRGNEDNDILFGGPGDDFVLGSVGNDMLFAGSDLTSDSGQLAYGAEGNDTTTVFVGEISGCLVIQDGGGASDIANLIGFGPYSVSTPFGQPDYAGGWMLVIDPITGGWIAIQVDTDGDIGVETIHGLNTPNGFLVPPNGLPQLCLEQVA